jgi:predicted 2-oxoglutarate/Fe(II)-dependent dioxygenase YbiX
MHVILPGGGRPYVQGDWLDLSGPLAFTVDGALDAAACAEMIARIEALGPAAAPITTGAGFAMRPEIRNNTRVMFDDPVLAGALFRRLAAAIPARLFDRHAVGVNERFRGYRYEPGQRFAPHRDGCFRRSADEQSELTLMVYLNADFTGGATTFLDAGVAVQPRPGMALLFQHNLEHEGSVVHTGAKYALRTDVMYARRAGTEGAPEAS